MTTDADEQDAEEAGTGIGCVLGSIMYTSSGVILLMAFGLIQNLVIGIVAVVILVADIGLMALYHKKREALGRVNEDNPEVDK